MKILVIQQKMIGDVLTSSIICENLKKAQPDSLVHYMAHENTIAVIENNPLIDKIVVFSGKYRQSKASFLSFLREIRKEKYDVVIDAYGKLESNLITLFSGAKQKIGWKKWYTSMIYTKLYSAKDQTKGNELAVNDRLLLVESFLGKDQKVVKKPKIYLTAKEINDAISLLGEHGISRSRNLIMIGLLGSAYNKTYPPNYMAAVLDEICEQTSSVMLFNYLPSQKQQVRAVYDLCSEKTQKTIKLDVFADSLRGFLGILSQCSAIIGNEGGAINMAKALQIPSFSIYSPWINKEAWNLFEDDLNQAVHLKDFEPQLYTGLTKKQQKEMALGLYQHFKPTLVKPSLLSFLDHIKNTPAK